MKKIEDINNDDMDLKELFSEVKFRDAVFVNKDAVGDAIMERIGASRKRAVRHTWIAAASLVLAVLSTATWLMNNREFVSGEAVLALKLPDGSQVQMQENSQLSYNRIGWLWKRDVRFQGNARFKVAKGERFTVSTGFGGVAVLGTEFAVTAHKDTLVVECFSGAVDVKTQVGEQILHADEKVECSPRGMIFTPAQEPLPVFLEYDHVPLTQVVDKIEELYGVTVTPGDVCRGIIYDGLLPTGDLDEALEIVMSSCGITYSTDGKQIIISRYANK